MIPQTHAFQKTRAWECTLLFLSLWQGAQVDPRGTLAKLPNPTWRAPVKDLILKKNKEEEKE